MKKIAIIMDDEIRPFTITRIAGIFQKIKESKEEVNLYIFRSSGASGMDDDYNTGEYNIYHLPDFSDFDGIIIDLNNVKKTDNLSCGVKAANYVIDQIKKSGKPTISIANDFEDFYFVGIDNSASMRSIITHLHKEHRCKKYWFVMGPKGNYENRIRTQALLDYMNEHHISYTENDFYFENYEYQCGLHGFEALLSKHNELPDAIICANDNIAIGVCEMAKEKGYHVPKDFKVTGFDNSKKSAIYSPRITTINQMNRETGYRCAEIMLRILNGESVPRINYTETCNVFGDSCGCKANQDEAIRAYIQEQISYDVSDTEYSEQMQALTYALNHCTSVVELCRLMVEHISVIKDISLYLILDNDMITLGKPQEKQEQLLIEKEQFCVEGYPTDIRMVFAYENGDVKEITPKEISHLFPTFESETAGTDFTFLPLHFGMYTVGYFVVKNAISLIENRYLIKVIDTLSTSIENLYKKERLTYANDMLSYLYIRDSMTGLFNRLGYQQKALPLFMQKKAKKENLTILFFDMDNLKYMNDTYGHEYGDFAIKIIANAIFHTCKEDTIPIRWGGDEFLAISPALNVEQLEHTKNQIRIEIDTNAKKMNFPCSLTVSIGSIDTDSYTEKTLDDYIQEADQLMYIEKQNKKRH